MPVIESTDITATEGLHEQTFTVTDTSFPVGITVLADQFVFLAEVYDSSGNRVGAVRDGVGTVRQKNYTFRPTTPGTFTLRVLTTPGSSLTTVISHNLDDGEPA